MKERSHIGAAAMLGWAVFSAGGDGEKETTAGIWKAVTKIWLGEGRGGQGQ